MGRSSSMAMEPSTMAASIVEEIFACVKVDTKVLIRTKRIISGKLVPSYSSVPSSAHQRHTCIPNDKIVLAIPLKAAERYIICDLNAFSNTMMYFLNRTASLFPLFSMVNTFNKMFYCSLVNQDIFLISGYSKYKFDLQEKHI